jgi:hypothetical protein
MQEVLSSTKAQNVHFFIVWLPILRSDGRNAAIERSREFSDERITYYWDETGITGLAWQKVLGLPSAAWDVYLLYEAGGTKWDKSPEKPFFWMHQLQGIDSAPILNKDEFKLKMLQLLDK